MWKNIEHLQTQPRSEINRKSSNDCGTTIYSSFLELSAQRLVLFLFTPGQEGKVKAAVTEEELSAGVEKMSVLRIYQGLKELNNLPKRKG